MRVCVLLFVLLRVSCVLVFVGLTIVLDIKMLRLFVIGWFDEFV